MLFIISLLIVVGAVFAAVTIIYYVVAAVSCVADIVNKTEIEVKDAEVHLCGEDVNDVIDLYEEVGDELHES